MKLLSKLIKSQLQINKPLVINSPVKRMSIISHHVETPFNDDKVPFEFTATSYAEIEKVLTKYPSNYKKSAVIPVLFIAQKQNDNFLSLSAMKKVAKVLDIPEMDVYEVASFYTMFNRQKVGKYHLQVCGTTPCQLRGAEDIIQAVKDYADVGMEQTSKCGTFTLSEVECLGACANAPMIQVNNEWVYEDLTPETMVQLMQQFEKGETPNVGPQNGRVNAEGIEGRTSLQQFNFETKHTRDFAKAKEEWLKAKEEAEKKRAQAARK